MAGSKLTPALGRSSFEHVNPATTSEQVVGRLLSRFQVQGLAVARTVVAHIAGDSDDFLIQRERPIVRDEADVQADAMAAEELGKIGDFLELLGAGRARGGGNEADGAGDRGDVSVAFALEAAEDAGQLDAVADEPLEERVGVSFGSCRLVRGVELNGGDAQVVGDFEFDAESGIYAGE